MSGAQVFSGGRSPGNERQIVIVADMRNGNVKFTTCLGELREDGTVDSSTAMTSLGSFILTTEEIAEIARVRGIT